MAFLNDEIEQLRNVLKASKATVIEKERCFVMDAPQFMRAISLLRVWDPEFKFSSQLAAAGWDNLQVGISQLEKHAYYIVCNELPSIDTIWDGMPKKSIDKKE